MSEPPVCMRECVYLPGEDVVLISGARYAVLPVSGEPGLHTQAGQNRALVYDPRRDPVPLVPGARGDAGKAEVCALRYRRNHASRR